MAGMIHIQAGMTRLLPQRLNAAIMERIGRAQLRMEDGQLYWTEQS